MIERRTVPPEMIEPADTIESSAWPAATVVLEDELGRRQLGRAGEDGPVAVVQVERRLHGDQVHAGVVVAVERADVAPVTPFDPVHPRTCCQRNRRRGPRRSPPNAGRYRRPCHGGCWSPGVLAEGVHQGGGVEDVVTHRGVKVLILPAASATGDLRLFDETVDDRPSAGLDDAETVRLGGAAPRWRPPSPPAPLSMCWRSIWLGSIR